MMRLALWLSGKEYACNAGDVGSIPRRRKRQPTPVFLSGKSHGQRRLEGYHPWGHKRVGHDLAAKQEQQQQCSWWYTLVKILSKANSGSSFTPSLPLPPSFLTSLSLFFLSFSFMLVVLQLIITHPGQTSQKTLCFHSLWGDGVIRATLDWATLELQPKRQSFEANTRFKSCLSLHLSSFCHHIWCFYIL